MGRPISQIRQCVGCSNCCCAGSKAWASPFLPRSPSKHCTCCFLTPCPPARPYQQIQERLQTHWLWRHAMRELREAGERAEAEAAAKAALAKLSGGGRQGGGAAEKEAEVAVHANAAPPA